MLKKRVPAKEAMTYFGVKTYKALRTREKAGLKPRKDKGSKNKYYFEEDIIKFMGI